MKMSAKEQAIAKIAKEVLWLETLKTRNSDSLDFYDLSVWGIREALDRAYEEGAKSNSPA